MPVTNVSTKWESGNLVYYDSSGNTIATWDGTNGLLDVATNNLAINNTAITASATEINQLVRAERVVKVATVTMSDTSGNAGMLAWQNPESSDIIVERVIIDVTTEATGAANIDVGTDGDGTGTSDNLIDGADIGSAAVVLDNIDDQGTNGKSKQRLDANGGTTDYITATASADPAGFVGVAYIQYVVV